MEPREEETGGRVSIGIAGAVGAETAARLAPAVEAAGCHALWINETPGTDALAVAAAAAAATSRLHVATGVIALDRRGAEEVADEVERLAIPQERLVVGIGSGQAGRGALALVAGAVDTLHERLAAPVVIGALGPRMRRLAAERADGVVLNWLTPEAAAAQRAEHHAIEASGRVVLYARTLGDEAARPALEKEAAAYETFPTYAANFARLGFGPLDAVVDATRSDAADRVAAYAAAVDEVVLRAVAPSDGADDLLRFVDAVGPLVAAVQTSR